jgi:hypothetical protein
MLHLPPSHILSGLLFGDKVGGWCDGKICVEHWVMMSMMMNG